LRKLVQQREDLQRHLDQKLEEEQTLVDQLYLELLDLLVA